jgi:hypothetical protein
MIRMTVYSSLLAASFAFTVTASGAAQHATATRAELKVWLEQLRAAGVDVAVPLSWRYAFSASDSARLEALSLELVAAGYAIDALQPGGAGGARLSVTRAELLTPIGLERRNRDLASLARKHGARYDGIDVTGTGVR